MPILIVTRVDCYKNKAERLYRLYEQKVESGVDWNGYRIDCSASALLKKTVIHLINWTLSPYGKSSFEKPVKVLITMFTNSSEARNHSYTLPQNGVNPTSMPL